MTTRKLLLTGVCFSALLLSFIYHRLAITFTVPAAPAHNVASLARRNFKPLITSSTDPIFIGAGDIANCGADEDEATAQLLDVITGTIYTLGDNAYPDGTSANFADCFGPTWGRHLARIKPVPGNHDYHVTGAAGYYSYFGAAASPQDVNCTSDCKGYYSYDLGAWHIIALNSEIDVKAGSAQEQWLRQDLAAHPTACTLAYWHKPRFSSGEHQNNTNFHAFWVALYEAGVDVVLNGHDHNYERFAPQDPSAQADANGIREFVVGTGGTGQRPFSRIQPNSEVRATDSWGVLQFTLHETSYDWQFIPIAGQNFQDSGSGNCVVREQPQGRIEQVVNQSSDDAEEGTPRAPVYLNSTDLELTIDATTPQVTQTVGVRFAALALTRQMTITRAYVEFTVDEVSTETTTVQIYGEATGNALTFSTTPANISQRARTVATVAWPNIPVWPTVGEKVRTPDLTPILQEVVNRSDWAAGNALALIMSGVGRRTAVAYDGNPSQAPLLHVEYATPALVLSRHLYLPLIQAKPSSLTDAITH
ncbi:MAG: hypothetical protein DYG89_18890 [Caldilinea sp. CFX5]|nr:hypothetical protein [Caldilinea sp. CFX5]